MNKSILTGAIAMALGTSAQSAVTSVNVTSMDFGGNYAATGTLFSDGIGTVSSIDPFYGVNWTVWAVEFFDTTGVQSTWAGTSLQGAYNYQFTLGAGQVAWGTKFNWNMNNDIPVLAIMDCAANPSVGGLCVGIGTPMQTNPFPGSVFAFNGTVAGTSLVPVPAAAWLMGCGILTLISVAKHGRQNV